MDDSSAGQTNQSAQIPHSSQQQPQHATGSNNIQPSGAGASFTPTNTNNSTDENQNTG